MNKIIILTLFIISVNALADGPTMDFCEENPSHEDCRELIRINIFLFIGMLIFSVSLPIIQLCWHKKLDSMEIDYSKAKDDDLISVKDIASVTKDDVKCFDCQRMSKRITMIFETYDNYYGYLEFNKRCDCHPEDELYESIVAIDKDENMIATLSSDRVAKRRFRWVQLVAHDVHLNAVVS